MKKELTIVFRIFDESIKRKINEIRQKGIDLTELFSKWIMEYEIEDKY